MSGTRKQVTVVINGEEYVSTAAKQAEAGITMFGKKIPFVLDATKLLEMGLNAVKAVFGALKNFAVDSIRAYDDFAASQTKLTAMSKLTGVSMGEMRDLVKQARDEFGLSTVASSDLAGSVAKFAAQAGSASKAGGLMAAALEIGAASGMTAAQVAEGLSSALAGNDEWLNRIGLANPSQLWKDYAAANGRAVGTLTDTEQKLAVMTAIMDAGNKVAGTYAERMESGAGAQDRLNNKLEDAKVAFGTAMQPVRVFVVQGLTSLVEVGGRVTLAIARVVNAIGVAFTGAVESARSGVGFLAIGIGKLTGNKELEDWGRNQSTAFSDFRAQLDKLEDKYLTTGKAAQESETKQVTAARNVAAAGKAAAETTEQAADRLNKALDAKLGRPMAVAIGLTEGAVTSLGRAAVDQLPTQQSEKFLTHMQGLVTASESARDRILGIKDGTGTAATRTRDMAREVEVFARGTLDAADAFGVIDDKSRRSLDSAISIATAIGGIIKSGFSFAGVTGVIGGVAALVNTMMSGDNERRQLQRESNERLRDNNARLKELTKEVGLLTLDVSGGEVASIEAILEDIVPKLARGGDVFGGPNSFSSIIRGATSSLISQGLGWDSLVALAKRFGMNILDKDGAIDFAQLPVLLQALRNTNTAAPGQSFDSQLEILQQGFGVNATGDVSQIGQIMNLAERFSPALRGVFRGNNIAGTRADLQRLFNDLAAGRFTEAQLGGLTGSQFLRVITDVIGRIDRLPSGASTGPSGPTGSSAPAPTGGASGAPVTGAGGSAPPAGPAGGEVPAETIQSVIKAMDARMLSVLSSHTPLIDRIAVATEASATSLRSIDSKMDTLIEVTAGNLDATDARLEAMRRLAALERGERPVLG
jgi:hypothetical protein